jgi:penicillin G amidase
MHKLKKWLLGIAVLLLLAIVVAGVFLHRTARKALPDYNRSLVLPGLMDEVEVFRDKHAIPHVYARNERDLYLATGYIMAQDRLWQMDLLRRVTTGRLSEIFGADMLESDLLLRALRFPEKSDAVLAGSTEEVKQALEAFSQGVNHFILDNRKQLPPEFTILGYTPDPWQPAHSVNLIGYMAWDLAGSWLSEVVMHKLRHHLDEEQFRELMPSLDQHDTHVYPKLEAVDAAELFALLDQNSRLRDMGLEVFSASNNWAVSGEKSVTGHPLLANDMHLGYNVPGIWYQMHQVVEGRLNVSGVVLPGQPLVIVGHNERIAWGMSNVYVDDMDFYLETLCPEGSDRYLFNGEWIPLEVREEMIPVKGGDIVREHLRFTHRGPIISRFKKVKDQAISMRWTGNDLSDELRSMYLLNRAGDWESFRDALSTMTSISQNIIYADVDGNIGMQTAVGIPLRNAGNGFYIYPGETDRYDWTGKVPFAEVPYVYNPSEGHISSANNRTIGDDYPYYIGYQFDLPFRIDRIREMLEEKEKLGVEDFKRMMGDYQSKMVERYLGELLVILETGDSWSENELKAIQMLKEWNMELHAESVATSIFETFYLQFVEHVMLDEMGPDLYREYLADKTAVRSMFDHFWRNRGSVWINNVHTDTEESFEEIVHLSLGKTVQWLEEKLGPDVDHWAWGRLHQLSLSHPLGSVAVLDRLFGFNRGPFPLGGSFHTVCPYAYDYRDPFAVKHGASQRHIYNLGDWSDSKVIIPLGTSGIPASPHYADQTKYYLNNEFFNIPWEREDVENRAVYRSVLSPPAP